MCYTNCNSTFKYSYNNTCWNTCPSGTYLTYTNVICAACSSVCLTCTGSPTNCLSCSTNFYFNFTCLSVCPQGYYGSTNLVCLTCSGSTSAACNQPLNFTTSYSIQNYQYVIAMQFNQNVSLSEQL
jgi:proprotein convertase subtilisin/kexin type 5